MNDTSMLDRYDRRSIALHWLTAALVIALWAIGQTIDWFPREARVPPRSVHIVLGITLAVVVALRLRWRLRGGTRLPPAGAGWLGTAAALTHKLLYVLLVVTLLLGITNVWIRGDTLFHLFTVPAFDPGNRSLRKMVEGWHELAANTLLIVALLHAAAGLVHHLVLKDKVLQRMLPRRRG
jgi:cytochrome b561